MALFGSLSTLRTQLADRARLTEMWAYLDHCLNPQHEIHRRILALAAGVETRVELGGGLFALEQAYLSKDPAVARFESHLAHIDVQLIVGGVESMQVCDVRFLSVQENFTPARDIIFYHAPAQFSRLVVTAGEAAIFFPPDGHRPSLRLETPGLVQKTVVKIPVGVLAA